MTRSTLLVAALGALVFCAAIPARAQVERVAMRTAGLSCGDCAAISEIYLRRIDGVQDVKISKSQEAVLITYKLGTPFEPWEFRDALERTDVGVMQFQISARGRVQEEKGKRFFIAGKDKFLLAASSIKVPADSPVTAEGIVNDRTDPMELKVLKVTPLAK